MAAGGLGTAMADLLGFPQWAIFSLIVHGLQGLLIGIVLRKGLTVVRGLIAALISIAVVVGGYFVAGAILESPAVAVLEIVPNILQALSGSIIGIPLYWAVRRAYPPLEKYSERAG
jgi:uncharacterized membrane protein